MIRVRAQSPTCLCLERSERNGEIHEYFGLAIKNARLDCGLTQEALAERAGISCRYLIAMENEGRIPKLPAVYRLIHSLHISADLIFYPEQPSEGSERDIHILLRTVRAML